MHASEKGKPNNLTTLSPKTLDSNQETHRVIYIVVVVVSVRLYWNSCPIIQTRSEIKNSIT
jgi:hypothetical protein